MSTNKKFLDSGGLQTLWGIITSKFATKSEAITNLVFGKNATDSNKPVLGFGYADGTSSGSIDVPVASTENYGFMAPEHVDLINQFATSIDGIAPFAGLKLVDNNGSNDVSLSNRKASLKLEYSNDSNKHYIQLVDANYPSGSWIEKSKEDYEVAEDKSKWYLRLQSDNTAKYYYWDGTGDADDGPKDPTGAPIMSKAITKVDVTGLVTSGLLVGSDVVINPGNNEPGTYLKLIFSVTNDNGEPTTQEQYINVTDLVEIYTEGEGIEITESGTGMTDDVHTGEIKVRVATDDTLGAIKTGYTVPEGGNAKTYAVKLDDSSKAYVEVPWIETIVAHGDENFIEVKDGTNSNNQHVYSVSLSNSVKTSLGKAESALQEISILGKNINNNAGTILTVKEAQDALGLKSAAYVETTDEVSDSNSNNTVPTTSAVKDYVDTTFGNAIDSLDSELSAEKTSYDGNDTNKTAQEIFTKIVITDGKLDANNSTKTYLTISDIIDFTAMTDDDIKAAIDNAENPDNVVTNNIDNI